jgi:predicted HTH transcriptional regulator
MLTNEEILLKLAQQEDSFVERKSVNDVNDCLKTAVAFANSTPIGYPAIMFVGVKNDGEIENIVDLDRLQWSISEKISKAYPTIYTETRILEKDGKKCLAVLIPGSPQRPHFAGQSFIRDGAKSVVASDAQFNTLIAERDNKTYAILEWKRKSISVYRRGSEILINGTTNRRPDEKYKGRILDCNQFYVSLEIIQPHITRTVFIPLRLIDLSFDRESDCLSIEHGESVVY